MYTVHFEDKMTGYKWNYVPPVCASTALACADLASMQSYSRDSVALYLALVNLAPQELCMIVLHFYVHVYTLKRKPLVKGKILIVWNLNTFTFVS